MIKLKPTIYTKNIFTINFQEIKEAKIKLLCFDLDNTLSEPDNITKKIDIKIEKLLEQLQKDFDILIVSNNTIPGRVEFFADQVKLNYIKSMHKPFQKNYKENINLNKYQKKEIIFIGDKIVTDILGANLYGSKSILLDPLYPKSKKWYAFLMDLLDKIIFLFASTKRGKYFNDLENNE